MVNAQDGKETDPPGAQPRPSRWARFIGNIERNFHERKTKKEQENPTDRMARRTANATVAIAIFTIVLAIVGAVTLIEVIEGGTDTHELAVQARKQAEKMKDMSDAADKIRQAAEDMVAQEKRVADKAKDALDAGNRQSKAALDASIAASRNDQRAWVAHVGLQLDPPEVGKTIKAYISWNNSGKTFAKQVRPSCHIAFVANVVPDEATLMKMVGGTAPNISIGVLAPNAQSRTPMETKAPADETDKARIIGAWYTYIWGELTYYDVFGRPHTTIFCSSRQGITGDFIQCPFHNDAN